MAAADTGEERAWDQLSRGEPAEVSRRAAVRFEPGSGRYVIRSFGREFSVQPATRQLLALTAEGEPFLTRYAYFFRLSVLWYLVRAADASPSGRLVRPSGLPGGDTFFRGTHVLPLEPVAQRYAAGPAEFLAAGARLGGEAAGYGDAAVRLLPLPKVPVTVILWTADEEFPARADLLYDATGPSHLPLDLLWSVAMMSLLVLL